MAIEILLTTVIGTLILWGGSHFKAMVLRCCSCCCQNRYEHIAGMEEAAGNKCCDAVLPASWKLELQWKPAAESGFASLAIFGPSASES